MGERENGDVPSEEISDQRIRNLLAACKIWVTRYGSVRLRVFGLPQEDVHDRMVLIRDAQLRPVVGYHLSNSLQKANENYPLLITPIPTDVLQRVLDYTDELLRSSASPASHQSGGAVKLKNLFDSDAQQETPLRYIPVDVFNTARIGEILDWWLSSSNLTAADAPTLKGLLNASSLLCDDDLQGEAFEHLPPKIWQEGVQLPNFNSAWDALGTVLSSTQAGHTIYEAPDASVPQLREALLKYLDSNRLDAIQPPERRTMIDMTTELRRSLAGLMKQAQNPDVWFHFDVTEVSWGDYYALKVLWATDPAALVAWVEEGVDECFRENRRRQLGLKCAVRLISFEIYRSCSPRQLEALLKSANDLLRWIGYAAFESIAHDDFKALSPSGITSLLAPKDRLDLLGWMTERVAHQDKPIRPALIQELHASMPEKLDEATLVSSVNSMRNVLGNVYDTSPWMLQEVLIPLINTQRLEVDMVARLWSEELFKTWTGRDTSSVSFHFDTEGRFTDEVANLCAAASMNVRTEVLARVSKEVSAYARVVQRPLSAQIDWPSYNNAFKMLLWISAFLWAWLEQSSHPNQIELVLQSAEAALARRSKGDWDRFSSEELLRYRASHLPATV